MPQQYYDRQPSYDRQPNYDQQPFVDPEMEEACQAKPKAFRYKLIGLFLLILGGLAACGVAVGLAFFLGDFWGGHTGEIIMGTVLCAILGLVCLGFGRFFWVHMPVRDAMRLRDQREACFLLQHPHNP